MLATLTNSQFQSIGGEPDHEVSSAHYKGLGLRCVVSFECSSVPKFF